MVGETKDGKQGTIRDRIREAFLGVKAEGDHEATLRSKMRDVFGGKAPDLATVSAQARDGVIKTVKYGDPIVRYRQQETHKAYQSAAHADRPIDPLLLNDLYYSAYLPYAGIKEQSQTTAPPLHRAIVDAVNSSDYIDRLRRASLGNVTTSTAASTQLASVLVSELENIQNRSTNQEERQAAQDLLQAIQRSGQIGEDLAKQEQRMQDKIDRQQRKQKGKKGQEDQDQNREDQSEQGQSDQHDESEQDDKQSGQQDGQQSSKPRDSQQGEQDSREQDGPEESKPQTEGQQPEDPHSDQSQQGNKGKNDQAKEDKQKSSDQEGQEGGKSKLPFNLPFGLPVGKKGKGDDKEKQGDQQGVEPGQQGGQQQQGQQSPGGQRQSQSGQQQSGSQGTQSQSQNGGQQGQQGQGQQQSGQQQQGQGSQQGGQSQGQSGQQGQQSGQGQQGGGQSQGGQSQGRGSQGGGQSAGGGQGGATQNQSQNVNVNQPNQPGGKGERAMPGACGGSQTQNSKDTQKGAKAGDSGSSGQDGAGKDTSKLQMKQQRPLRQPTKDEIKEAERQMQMLQNPLIRNMLQNAVKQKAAASAAEKAEQVNEVQRVLNSDPYGGGITQGTGSSFMTGANIDEVLEICNNTNIMDILDVLKTIPKMRMPTRRKHTEYSHGDILDLKYTSDPEIARTADLALPDDIFYQKMSMSELGAFRRGVKERSTGPIYVLIDKSGSMSQVIYRSANKVVKMTWAKAVAIKLYQMAKRERKDFYARFFDDSTYNRLTSARDNKSDKIEMVKKLAEVKGTEGTDIQKAILAACDDVIGRGVTGVGEIVLITDGGADMDENATRERLAQAKVHLICIMIEGDNTVLKKLSKGYMSISQMTGENILRLIEIRKRIREEEEEALKRGVQYGGTQ